MNRITVDPKQMNGVPCIRGLRIPVATVVGMVAEGMTPDEILRSFPDLEAAIRQRGLRDVIRHGSLAHCAAGRRAFASITIERGRERPRGHTRIFGLRIVIVMLRIAK